MKYNQNMTISMLYDSTDQKWYITCVDKSSKHTEIKLFAFDDPTKAKIAGRNIAWAVGAKSDELLY